MPKVSIITVNYNGETLLDGLLKSLENQSYKDFELIVVDNASKDGSLRLIDRYINESALDIKTVLSDRNNGFAGGSLVGLEHANGQYLALLNNDTEPSPEWLDSVVKVMDKDPSVGICASRLINHGTNVIDSAGDGFSSLLKGFKRGEGEKASLYDKEEYVFGACAGAALYRRSMIEEIGFLDADFFLIHEDTDLNLRAHLYGWKVIYVPDAIVSHKVGSTIGKMSDLAIYHALRNSELVRFKNVPVSLLLLCSPWFVLGTISEFFYFAVKHKQPALYFRAKIDALKMLPLMVDKRRSNMQAMKVSCKELMETITPVLNAEFLKNKIKKLIHE